MASKQIAKPIPPCPPLPVVFSMTPEVKETIIKALRFWDGYDLDKRESESQEEWELRQQIISDLGGKSLLPGDNQDAPWFCTAEELAASKASHGCTGAFCYDCDLGPDN